MILDYVYAFLIGGAICALSQILIEYLKLTPGIVTGLFVIFGGVLEIFGFYDKLIDIGGSGATIPITNFGKLVVESSYKGIVDKGLLGAFSNVLESTGAGISVTIILGLLVSLVFKPKE